MPEVELSEGRVHYREAGVEARSGANSGAGPGVPVVLLHANPGDGRDYDAIVGRVAEKNRVIVLDWPGYGNSPAPPRPSEVTVLSLLPSAQGVLGRARVGSGGFHWQLHRRQLRRAIGLRVARGR